MPTHEKFEVEKDIIMYAFRYCLGRKTYATGTMSNYIIEHWDKFDIFTKDQIKHEIKEAVNRREAGMEIDVVNWMRVMSK